MAFKQDLCSAKLKAAIDGGDYFEFDSNPSPQIGNSTIAAFGAKRTNVFVAFVRHISVQTTLPTCILALTFPPWDFKAYVFCILVFIYPFVR